MERQADTNRVAVTASFCSDARSLPFDQSSYHDSADSSGESDPALQGEVAATDYTGLPSYAASLAVVFENDDNCPTRVTALGVTAHTNLAQQNKQTGGPEPESGALMATA